MVDLSQILLVLLILSLSTVKCEAGKPELVVLLYTFSSMSSYLGHLVLSISSYPPIASYLSSHVLLSFLLDTQVSNNFLISCLAFAVILFIVVPDLHILSFTYIFKYLKLSTCPTCLPFNRILCILFFAATTMFLYFDLHICFTNFFL